MTPAAGMEKMIRAGLDTHPQEPTVNSLVQDILGFLHDGRQFAEIRPDKTDGQRRRVEFVTPDGASEVREYECDHPAFMEWWKQSTGHLRLTIETFRQAEERL